MAKREIRTVSVPPELASQIARYPDENWSAVACEAFAQRLAHLDAMKMKDTTKQAVARLRASKARAASELYRAGEIVGATFALKTAEWGELDRLTRWADAIDRESSVSFEDFSFNQVAKVIQDEPSNVELELTREMREEHGDDINSADWIHGFIRGARAKFEELNEKME
jgi:hypothetical protein